MSDKIYEEENQREKKEECGRREMLKQREGERRK